MSNIERYADLQADFYHYMVKYGGIAKKTSGDYVTRMKFLAHHYLLDETLTQEKIEDILRQEDLKRESRSVYTSKKSISDFRAGLHKFLAFIHSDYYGRINDSILRELRTVENDHTIKVTEKQSIIKSRLGQGLFRNELIDYWHGCAISQCPLTWMLIASHIKPWRDSDNKERLDPLQWSAVAPQLRQTVRLGIYYVQSKGAVALFPTDRQV